MPRLAGWLLSVGITILATITLVGLGAAKTFSHVWVDIAVVLIAMLVLFTCCIGHYADRRPRVTHYTD